MIVLLLAVTGNAGEPPDDERGPPRRARPSGERRGPARRRAPVVPAPGVPHASIVVPLGWAGGAYLLPDGRPYY